MDIHEVTVGQFNQFVEESGYAYNRWQDVTKYSPGDDYPMVYVSWHDIVATAKQDAQNNESKFKWMLGGCCLIGTGMAYVAKPAPPKTALSDKSADYVEIYEQAYESEAKKIRRKGAWIGTAGTAVAIPLAFVGFIALLIVSGAGYR